MALTHLRVTNAKPAAKIYSLTDSLGLHLRIETTGAKRWRMNYRFEGAPKTLYFGSWPDVSLGEAREKRDAARKLLAANLDPVAEEQRLELERQIAKANTFKAVAEEWFEKNRAEGRAQVTLDKIGWLLGMIYPTLGDRPIALITAQDVLFALRKVEATGRYESARRMRSVFSRIFRYAIATARAERDVAADLRGALITPNVTHLAAITTNDGTGQLLRAIDSFEGHAVTRYALQLAPHLFVRPGELRAAEWDELDAGAATWSLPAAKTKMRRPHCVPLSSQVMALLFELHKITGHGKYLFPSFVSAQRPMSENTLNAALRRLGYSQSEMTSHGFRAMAATLLNEMGLWHPDVIERQLAHLDKSAVRRAYTRGEYWDDRVRMMQHWSDHLDKLRATKPALRQSFGTNVESRVRTTFASAPSSFETKSAWSGRP